MTKYWRGRPLKQIVGGHVPVVSELMTMGREVASDYGHCKL